MISLVERHCYLAESTLCVSAAAVLSRCGLSQSDWSPLVRSGLVWFRPGGTGGWRMRSRSPLLALAVPWPHCQRPDGLPVHAPSVCPNLGISSVHLESSLARSGRQCRYLLHHWDPVRTVYVGSLADSGPAKRRPECQVASHARSGNTTQQ